MIISFYFLVVKKIKIIHIRSYIPGLMIIFYKNFFKFKLIFDMRGFWPEEKIDRHATQTKPIINCLVYALQGFFH